MNNKYTILCEVLDITQEIQNLEEEDPLNSGERNNLFWQKVSYPVRRMFSKNAVHPDDAEMNILKQRRVVQGITKDRPRVSPKSVQQNPSIKQATNRQSKRWGKVLAASLEL